MFLRILINFIIVLSVLFMGGARPMLSEEAELQSVLDKLSNVPVIQLPLIQGVIFPGEKKTHSICISPAYKANFVQFIFVSESEGIILSLITPSGCLINTSTVKSLAGVQEIPGGYMIMDPEIGEWKAEITAPDILGKTNYRLMTLLGSRMVLACSSDKYHYRPKEPLRLSAVFCVEKRPITKAKVMAKIMKPDFSVKEINLYDDGTHGDSVAGDGIYFNIFKETELKGTYQIAFSAIETVDGEEVKAESSTVMWVELKHDLTLSPSDIRFSKDNPKTEEEIIIYATVHNIGEIPVKAVEVFFYEGDPKKEGREIGEAKILGEILPGGAGETSIKYKTSRYGGIYDIYAVISPFLPIQEEDYDNNKAYREFPVFGVAAPSLTGVYSDYGVDENNDGLYNWLVIEVEVNVTREGNYDVTGWLYSEEDKYAGFTNSYSLLKTGKQTVKLSFQASNILSALKKNEAVRFKLKDLMLHDDDVIYSKEGKLLELRKVAYITQSYKCADFQKYGKIVGQVIDADGKPIPYAYVKAIGKMGYGVATTKEDGCYTIDDLLEGNYTVSVDPRDYSLIKEMVTVDVFMEKEIIVDFKLKRRF